MKRYIDVDAFATILKSHVLYLNDVYGNDCAVGNTLKIVIDEINAFPAVDVQEVKHGEWNRIKQIKHWADTETVSTNIAGFYCSLCGMEEKFKYNYCPNCGAKMNGEK